MCLFLCHTFSPQPAGISRRDDSGRWMGLSWKNSGGSCFFFFLLHHFFFSSVYSETISNYTACAPQTCGTNSVNYPFSLPSQSGSGCGYPGLTLHCNDNNQTLLLQTSTLNFTVTNIDYPNRTIDVAIDPKYIVDSGSCRYPQKSITIQDINPLVFKFSGDTTTATFYYNCSTPPTAEGGGGFTGSGSTYNFNSNLVPACSAGTQSSYIFLNGNLPDITMNCDSTLTFPASSTANNLATALTNGFSMNWTIDACDRCLQSGGRCGSYPDSSFACFCQGDTHQATCNHSRSEGLNTKVVTGIIAAVSAFLIVTCTCTWYCCKRCTFPSRYKSLTTAKLESFLSEYKALTVTRYTYNEIKRMTDKFEHKLGQGGYGSVFKGKLPSGHLVAVKLMEKSYNDGEEFINEVTTIGRIHHVNVVRLLGFCVEGSKKALIYEFMANGSLDKHIQMNGATRNSHLEWEKLQSIAMAIAKGIEYLHQGCDQGIIHFDIKPHNILLDEDFTPKISDFGLAKLHCKERSQLTITQGKGTIGYIAPEVFYGNLKHVSHKSDVYSYGMLLIAMVGMKYETNSSGSNTSDAYFPQCIYNRFCHDREREVVQNLQINGEEIMKKMTIIALWCILWNPVDRPSMKKVLGMFENDEADLEMPPNHFFPAAQSDCVPLDFESSSFSH